MAEPLKTRLWRHRRMAALLLLLLGSLGLLGWAVDHVVKNRALHQDGAEARTQLHLYAAALQRYVERYRTLPAVLALDPQLREALMKPLDAAARQRLNQRMEEVNGVTQSSTLTLIDRNGLSIAASNWRLPSSNVDHDYTFRPYFYQAVRNGSATFYGVGVTTGVAGFFMSEAIHGPAGEVLGVVVIKLELAELEASWQDSRDVILISDEHGVVILANRPDWMYRGLRPIGAAERGEIERTRPYSGHLPEPVAQRPRRSLGADGELVLFGPGAPGGDREWLRQTLPLPAEGWALHLLRDPAPSRSEAREAAFAGGALWLALVFLGLFAHGRVRLARWRRRSRQELEQMVQQHAVALRTARDGVVEAARQAALGHGASLEHLAQGVSVVDAELRLVAWNRRYVELFRYPAELVQAGRPIADLVRFNAERGWLGPGNPEEAIARRLAHLRAGTPYLHERERPDGTTLEIRGNPVPGGGFVTSYADITAYKNAARELRSLAETLERRVSERTRDLQLAKGEAERANLYKTRFIAAAVHDLLQPLNAARMFVSALRGRVEGEPRTLVDNVDQALTAQDGILGSLLDISRLESGALEVRRRQLPLDALLEGLARDFGVLAQSRGLRLRRVRTRAVVDSDEALLRRILQNFLSNAIHYPPRGGVLLGCRRAGAAVRIEVWDSGVGIPEAQHGAIFEEFRRLDTGRTTQDRGAGLGLAIVERIARLLDHRIGLRSWPGRGSVFSVTVPRAGGNAPRAAAPDDGSSLHGLRVWCIDPDQRARAATCALLQGWDCRVTPLADVPAALREAATGAAPQVLLLGDTAARDGAGNLAPLLAGWNQMVPVIAIAAGRDAALLQAARDAGWGFLPGPIRPAALRALISRQIASQV